MREAIANASRRRRFAPGAGPEGSNGRAAKRMPEDDRGIRVDRRGCLQFGNGD